VVSRAIFTSITTTLTGDRPYIRWSPNPRRATPLCRALRRAVTAYGEVSGQPGGAASVGHRGGRERYIKLGWAAAGRSGALYRTTPRREGTAAAAADGRRERPVDCPAAVRSCTAGDGRRYKLLHSIIAVGLYTTIRRLMTQRLNAVGRPRSPKKQASALGRACGHACSIRIATNRMSCRCCFLELFRNPALWTI